MDIKRIDVNAKMKLYETSKKEDLKTNAEQNKNAASKTENQDKINISKEAKNLNILDFAKSRIRTEMYKDLPDTANAEKINALKEQIRYGEYAVSAADIAAAVFTAKGYVKMNFEPLIQTLESEVEIYKTFKETEENKTAVIAEGNIEKLDEMLNVGHMLHMKLQSAEKKRIETMNALGLNGHTLAEVIGFATGGDKEKLSCISDDLNFYTDALKKINDYNTKLVKSRLDIISSVTKLMKEPQKGAKNAGSEKIYGKNAKVLDRPNEFGKPVINKKI